MVVKTISASVKVFKDITEMMEKASEMANTLNNSDLILTLVQTKVKLAEAEFEHIEKEKRIRELEGALKLKEEMEYDPIEAAYRIKGEDSSLRFCTPCWSAKGLQIPLMSRVVMGGSTEIWRCPNCEKSHERGGVSQNF